MKRTWRNLLYTAWDVSCIQLCRLTSTLRSKLSLALQGCRFGIHFTTIGPCSFKARTEGSIQIGDHVTLLSHWRSNRVGLVGQVLLQTFGDGKIVIGDHSGGSAVVLSSRASIQIGKHVKLGGNVKIFDHDFHSLNFAERRSLEDSEHVLSRPVILGDDVFVGANSIILKGVQLGDRVIVGAGSVVTKSFEADTVISGNPAVVVRKK